MRAGAHSREAGMADGGEVEGGEPQAAPVEINGTTYQALADGVYDVVCCGTGLKECILAGMLAHKGKKVRGRGGRREARGG